MLAPVTAHTILIQRKAAAGLNLLKRLRDWQFPRTIKPPTRLPFRRYQAHLAQNVLSYRNVGHQAQCQGLVVLLIVDSMLRQFNDLPIFEGVSAGAVVLNTALFTSALEGYVRL